MTTNTDKHKKLNARMGKAGNRKDLPAGAGGAATFSFGCGSSLEMKGTEKMNTVTKHYLASDYEDHAKQLIAEVFFDVFRNEEIKTDFLGKDWDRDAAEWFAALGEIRIDTDTAAFFMYNMENLDLYRKLFRAACLTESEPEAALARGIAMLYTLYGEAVFDVHEKKAPMAVLYLLVNDNSPQDACR